MFFRGEPEDPNRDYIFGPSSRIVSGIAGEQALAVRDLKTDEPCCPACRILEREQADAGKTGEVRCEDCQEQMDAGAFYPEVD